MSSDESQKESQGKNMQWITSQIGAREHYAIPRVLHRAGKLQHLYTDFWATAPWRLLGKLSGRANLANRFHANLKDAPIAAFNIQALKASRQRFANPYEGFLQVGRQFGELVVKDLKTRDEGRGTRAKINTANSTALDARRSTLDTNTIFFGYDTGFLEPAQWIKGRGGKAIVCQMDPARYEVNLVKAEEKRWPGWARHSVDVPETYFCRRQAEWEVADLVMVNSEWTKTALIRQGVGDDKIVVVPLAYEALSVEGRETRDEGYAGRVEGREPSHSEVARKTTEGSPKGATASGRLWRQTRVESFHSGFSRKHPLRVLFLGQVILRKGIQYLIEAARLLEKESVHIDVVGPIGISDQAVASAPANMTFHGPVSRDRTEEFYRSADLFVLPTLSDGFALTQIEAMAYGLPVIATPNCGEVVTDQADGLIVPESDPNALAEAFQMIIQDPAKLEAMSKSTQAKVEHFSLGNLAKNLVRLEERLSGKS